MKCFTALLLFLLAWASPAWAATTFLEPGTSATYAFGPGYGLWDANISGDYTSSTTQVHGQPRSLRLSTGAGPAYAWVDTQNGVAVNAGGRGSLYVYFPSVSPAAAAMVVNLNSSGGASTHFTLSLSTAGKLTSKWVGGTLVTGATTVTASTWHRVSFAWTWTSTTVNESRVWLDGTLELTKTNDTTSAVALQTLELVADTAAGANFLEYFSDISMDDSSALTDPGDIRVTAKRPAAENTTSFDTAIGTARSATDYNNVNERISSLTNGWQHAAISDVQENYTLEAASVGDADLTGTTLVSRCAWIIAKGAAGGAGTPKIMDNGTETAIVLTSAAKTFTVCSDSASYPSNAAGIGMRSTNNADDTFFYEGGTVIAYTPAAGTNFFRRRVQ